MSVNVTHGCSRNKHEVKSSRLARTAHLGTVEGSFQEGVAIGHDVIVLSYPLVLVMLHAVRGNSLYIMGISEKMPTAGTAGQSCEVNVCHLRTSLPLCFHLPFCTLFGFFCFFFRKSNYLKQA